MMVLDVRSDPDVFNNDKNGVLMRPRRVRKRTLMILIFLFDCILVLFLVHSGKMSRGERARMGRMNWLGLNESLMKSLEFFRNGGFSDAIRKKWLVSTDVDGHGDVVDSILSRTCISARIMLTIETRKLKGLEVTMFPEFEDERMRRNLGEKYVEELAKEIIRRVDDGEIRYPMGNKEAKEYVMKMKSFVDDRRGGMEDRIVQLSSKKFPTIEVPFHAYVGLILLNIREMIVKDFDMIDPSLKIGTIYGISNETLNRHRNLLGMYCTSYKALDGEYECGLCHGNDESSVLLRMNCGDIVCEECFRYPFLYFEKGICPICKKECHDIPGGEG